MVIFFAWTVLQFCTPFAAPARWRRVARRREGVVDEALNAPQTYSDYTGITDSRNSERSAGQLTYRSTTGTRYAAKAKRKGAGAAPAGVARNVVVSARVRGGTREAHISWHVAHRGYKCKRNFKWELLVCMFPRP